MKPRSKKYNSSSIFKEDMAKHWFLNFYICRELMLIQAIPIYVDFAATHLLLLF